MRMRSIGFLLLAASVLSPVSFAAEGNGKMKTLQFTYSAQDYWLRMSRPKGAKWDRTVSGTSAIWKGFEGTLIEAELARCVIDRDKAQPIILADGQIRSLLGAPMVYSLVPFQERKVAPELVKKLARELYELRAETFEGREFPSHPCETSPTQRGDYEIVAYRAGTATPDSIAGHFKKDEKDCVGLFYDASARKKIASIVNQLCGAWFGKRFEAVMDQTPETIPSASPLSQ
jgi:hypothetical protein